MKPAPALALTLAWFLAVVPSARAQEGSPDPIPVSLIAPELRPATLVAEQVRRVLGAGTDSLAWQALAGALPDLAVTGEADIESTFAAVRVAEEAAGMFSPVRSGGVERATPAVLAGESPRRSPVFRFLRTIDAGFLGALLSLIAVGSVLWITVRRESPPPPKPEAPREVPDRFGEALAMVASGVSVTDIARHARVSKDAVAVLTRVRTP